MSLSSIINLNTKIAEEITSFDLANNATINLQKGYIQELADGTGAGNANEVYQTLETIDSGSAVEIDLYGGITDYFGNTITFSDIKAVIIKNKSGEDDTDTEDTTTEIEVGNSSGAAAGSGNEWTGWFGTEGDTEKIPGGGSDITGGIVCHTNSQSGGWAVDSTNRNLLIQNAASGNQADVEIIIVGSV